MPMRPVTIRRWEVVAAFVLLVFVAVGVAAYNDHRISESEKRITRNTLLIQRNTLVNEEQNRVRKLLVATFRKADMRSCERIEVLKKQNRIDARYSFHTLDTTLQLLHLTKTPEIVAFARKQLDRNLRRNRRGHCP